MTRDTRDQRCVIVAGASGFIGSALSDVFDDDDYDLIGLSRNPEAAVAWSDGYHWRQCDLFSRKQTFEAMKGADVAIYLVHSMLPSADLSQGTFADMDVICADNFARAAAHHGVEQIVYVSALLPRTASKSTWRRGEITHVLGSYDTEVTTLRAGFVIGPGGAATDMIFGLVERLPVMLLPKWTSSKVSPIARRDLVELIRFVIDHKANFPGTFEVGGAGVTTYRLMLATVADILGLERRLFRVPVVTPTLSARWISTVTGQPHSIVWPLVERFRHDLLPRENRLQNAAGQTPTPLRRSLQLARSAPAPRPEPAEAAVAIPRHQALTGVDEFNVVRSVQRLTLPHRRTTRWVAEEYARWLPHFMGPFIRASTYENTVRFHLGPLHRPLLTLDLDERISRTDRQLFWIRGGLLSAQHPNARLEFRRIPGRQAVLTAIHLYRPRLPWWIYRLTQAPFHHFVMHAFDRHLRRLDARLTRT